MSYKEYKVRVYENYTQWLNKDGILHREDGPAYESKISKQWIIHGNLHREEGPAIEYHDGDVEYWLDGVQYTKEDWKYEVKRAIELTVAEIEYKLGHKVKIVKESK